MTGVLILVGALALALGLAQAAWWLYWCWMDRWTEAVRDALAADRLQQHAEAYRKAVRAARRAWRLTDLDGSTIRVPEEQLPLFRSRCCEELGIRPSASWSSIRRHWRRSSLSWHPDHGGSVEVWLRKQRAYQVLEVLHRSSNGLDSGDASRH